MRGQTETVFEENVCGKEKNNFKGYFEIFILWQRPEDSKNRNYFKFNMGFLLRKPFIFLGKEGL